MPEHSELRGKYHPSWSERARDENLALKSIQNILHASGDSEAKRGLDQDVRWSYRSPEKLISCTRATRACGPRLVDYRERVTLNPIHAFRVAHVPLRHGMLCLDFSKL